LAAKQAPNGEKYPAPKTVPFETFITVSGARWVKTAIAVRKKITQPTVVRGEGVLIKKEKK